MSGNINDTNVDTITEQVDNLLYDLKSRAEGEPIDEARLQRKYKHLYKTSKTLFNFILKNHKDNNFDKEYFDKTLNLMLGSIRSIQNKSSSVHDESVLVGKHLAQTFIPQYKNDPKSGS